MARKVPGALWEILVNAWHEALPRHCRGALSQAIEAVRRNGKIEFVRVRNDEEYEVFALLQKRCSQAATRRDGV